MTLFSPDYDDSARPSPSDLIAGLTQPQVQAVEHRHSPLLVIAGAGSGKTRVLTRRIAHLLATGDAMAFEILAITFTNKAADEMRSRVVELIGPTAKSMWVATFHSACLRILRASADRIGYSSAFTVYDAQDAKRLVELIMGEMNLDMKKLPSRGVVSIISGAKSELKNPGDFREAASRSRNPDSLTIADIYSEYQRRLRAANAMDFDDLLMKTYELLRDHEDVLEAYRKRFQHILVDEYQDTNRAQNAIVMMLAAKHRNICVVGDSDQSIYRFRAADIRNILDFETSFEDAAVIVLEQNFRSTQRILDAANAVIANNPGRRAKRLFTDGDQGADIKLYHAEDEHDEAQWVATEVRRLGAAHEVSPANIAVFYRTNAQSRAIEEELVRSRIPYRVIGAMRFYDRREIKDALAYLKVVANPADEVSARRIVNVPKRGIGATSVSKIGAFCAINTISFSEAFARGAEAGVSGKALKGLASLSEVLATLRREASTLKPADLIELILEETGYRAELEAEKTHESEGRLENLAELVGVALSYESVEDFLSTISLVADSDELGQEVERVSLMTLHIAKGLEYPAVFLIGMEEGVFPHFRSMNDGDELEEERRLAYVGITRAMKYLNISHAWVRSLWGQTSHRLPSRFLGEIPQELVEDVGRVSGRQSLGRASRDETPWEFVESGEPGGKIWGQGVKAAEPPSTTGGHLLGIEAGDHVRHGRWGEGTVLSVTGTGDRATAKVRFPSVGEKSLMLSMAPLERL
jgi:DNA helicase-2/ATP-dependent DNA helicase PcrA